ncbi:MAG: competence type IV pilus major pilin ComGC [Erysipelotrichaceae bacterium]
MKKGFTLLEMIVVLSIITVIFLLTIPNIQKVLEIVDEKGCDAQLKIIDSAIIQYRLKYDIFPNSMADLVYDELINESQLVCQNGKNIILLNGQAYAQ